MVDGEEIIPFVKQFCDSWFLQEDDTGGVRRVRQGEGGEHALTLQSGPAQGDGVAVQAQLKEDNMSCVPPDGIGQIYLLLEEQLRQTSASTKERQSCGMQKDASRLSRNKG